MKKIYTLLLAVLCAATAYSQRNVNLELLPTMLGTYPFNQQVIAPYDTILYDDSTKFYIKWTIVNHGPDTLQFGDTVCIKSVNNITFKGYSIKIDPGDTLSLVPIPTPLKFKAPANATLPYIDTLSWCDSVYAFAPVSGSSITDPQTNNHNCVPITAYALKTSDVGQLADSKAIMQLYPNPATSRLTVNFEMNATAKDVRLLLRNTVGQVVYSHTAGNSSGTFTHTIDVGDLSPGFYLAELHYNDQVIVRKVSIQ